jgi:hypothetical protein
MTYSIRETIIAAAVAAIDSAVDVNVYRSRTTAFAAGQLPAVVVSPASDTPIDQGGSLCWADWNLTIMVDVVVAEDPPDQAADELHQLAHAALMAAPRSLGISSVIDIQPQSVQFMAENSGALTGATRTAYLIRYRTRQDDLAVAP